jgi:hypothetical protein
MSAVDERVHAGGGQGGRGRLAATLALALFAAAAIPGPCSYDPHPELDCGQGQSCPQGMACASDGFCKPGPGDGIAPEARCDPQACASGVCIQGRCAEECDTVACSAGFHCEPGAGCVADREGCNPENCRFPDFCENETCRAGAGCDPQNCPPPGFCEGDQCIAGSCDTSNCPPPGVCNNGVCDAVDPGGCEPRFGNGCNAGFGCLFTFPDGLGQPVPLCRPVSATPVPPFGFCFPSDSTNPCEHGSFCLPTGDSGVCLPFCTGPTSCVDPEQACGSPLVNEIGSGLIACVPRCAEGIGQCPSSFGACEVPSTPGVLCEDAQRVCLFAGCDATSCPASCNPAGAPVCSAQTSCTTDDSQAGRCGAVTGHTCQ